MPSAGARLDIREEQGGLVFLLQGRLDSATTGTVWRQAFAALRKASPDRLTIDAAGLEYCDGAGIGLLVELRSRRKDAEIRGLLTPLAALAERHRVAIIGVLHLTKAQQRQILHRVQGSTAFTAQARVVRFRRRIDPVDVLTALGA